MRVVCLLLALCVAGGFLYTAAQFRVPAHPGVDQNGYIVGGKMIAATGTMKFSPRLPGTDQFDPHQFVGRMWVGAELLSDRERYYPKYPIGLPLLYAGALAFGAEMGVEAIYWISPVAMTLAAVMTFLLGRLIAGSVAGLIAMLLFATAPVTLALTNNPNSHATAVFFVVSGMYFLMCYWRSGRGWTALAAGFMLGYAVTIRYSEGALLLPMGLVAIYVLCSRWHRLRSGLGRRLGGAALLGLGWAIPVGGLVAYNLAAMGTITGYDPTNESIGFSLDYALDNWETMLRQLATFGLFFVLPLTVAGAIAMLWWNWRLALVLAAWTLPCLLAYTFYYWAPDNSTVGYVRFFQTVIPALCIAAAWTCHRVATIAWERGRAAAAVVPMGVILAIGACTQLQQGLYLVEADSVGRHGLLQSVNEIQSATPEDATLICSEQNFLHHLQLLRSGALYTGETFNRGYVAGLMNRVDFDEPQMLDPMRRAALFQRLGAMDPKQLEEEQRRIVTASLSAGRRVFFVLPMRDGGGLPKNNEDEVGRRQWPEPLKKWEKAKEFQITLAAAWNIPTVRPAVDRSAPRRSRSTIRTDRRVGYWQVVELTAPPPATQPAPAKPPPQAKAPAPVAPPRTATTRPATTRPASPATQPAR